MASSLYWINETLAALPAVLWATIGLGLPWALVMLPRRDWGQRTMVAALTLAFGPMLLTAWMFILGTIGAGLDGGTPLLRFDLVLTGTVLLAASGVLLVWHKYRREESPPAITRQPLAFDEKLMVLLIVVAIALRWLTTAFWPFTAYDPIWVYGYESRLYTLQGFIPPTIDYYPQFLPLQYTFAQLAAGGISDHAARVVLPFMHVGSILMVYLLGGRLFSRRVGIFAAGMWALYPHVGEWAHVGDLEIPLTFLFSGAATFFLLAWRGQQPQRRYALIAGLFLGGAMWAKPTAGAFALGVLLLLLIDLIRLRFDWKSWRPRFEIALIAGLGSIPLGSVWYMRNLLLGHDAIDFPPPFWLTQARRSGGEFGWLLLALLLLLGFLYFRPGKPRPDLRGGLVGLLLILAGLVPSIISPQRMDWIEWALLALGAVVLFRTLRPYALSENFPRRLTTDVVIIGWGLGLALPYFATWFYGYSYHYRLSFPIVPLMILPSAVILSRWLPVARVDNWLGRRRLVYAGIIALLGLPGVVIPLHDNGAAWDWLWTDKLPDDFSRYSAENPSLMLAVQALQAYIDETGQQPVVVAPGAQLMPFFFLEADIRIAGLPTRLAQLDGATHYVYSQHARWAYADAGIDLLENQIVGALGRDEILHQKIAHDDGNFFYEVYELDLDQRFVDPEDSEITHLLEDEVVFGDFVRYVGENLSLNVFYRRGGTIYVDMLWEVLAPSPEDYKVFIHLINTDDGSLWAAWDGPIALRADQGYYSSRVWEPGELIIDRRKLRLQDPENTPPGNNYRVVVGLYTPGEDGKRVPVSINGQPDGDGMALLMPFTVQGRP